MVYANGPFGQLTDNAAGAPLAATAHGIWRFGAASGHAEDAERGEPATAAALPSEAIAPGRRRPRAMDPAKPSRWSWIDGIDVAADPFPELYRLTVTGPAGHIITETGVASTTFDIAELPGQPGQQIELGVAMVGPMASSRAASAILIL